jgi:hypothetical protein
MGFIALAEILLRPSTLSKKPNFYDLSLQFRSLFHHFFHHSSNFNLLLHQSYHVTSSDRSRGLPAYSYTLLFKIQPHRPRGDIWRGKKYLHIVARKQILSSRDHLSISTSNIIATSARGRSLEGSNHETGSNTQQRRPPAPLLPNGKPFHTSAANITPYRPEGWALEG